MNANLIFIVLTGASVAFFAFINSGQHAKPEYVPIRVDDRKE